MRRAMVFVDGSNLRDTLKSSFRQLRSPSSRKPLETLLDYERFGRRVCGDSREFLRLYYYTSTPGFFELEEPPGLHEHERENHTRALQRHRQLVDHLRACRRTVLRTGRVNTQRINTSLDSSYEWIEKVWGSAAAAITEEDRQTLAKSQDLRQQGRELRRKLVDRLQALRKSRAIAPAFIAGYSEHMSRLLGAYTEFSEKGVDTALAVEMVALALTNAYDDAVIVAADEDYLPVLEQLMAYGKCTIHAFPEIPRRPGYGDALRSACDESVILTEADLRALLPADGKAATTQAR